MALAMARPRQHLLPAAVIGGFGDTASGTGRDPLVAVRRMGGNKVEVVKANAVGFERGLYTLSNPPPGLDANRIDQVFATVEPHLPAAIASLEAGRQKAAEQEVLQM